MGCAVWALVLLKCSLRPMSVWGSGSAAARPRKVTALVTGNGSVSIGFNPFARLAHGFPSPVPFINPGRPRDAVGLVSCVVMSGLRRSLCALVSP